MLTAARPIFEHVPASFADPVGLAEQQAPGVVSLIVVHYPASDTPHPAPDSALGPVYDAYVAVSGGLLSVARTTADYRYPVAPSVALARFTEHRDAGRSASLSLFELAEADCTRFVETVYFSECLKLHVDGAASAPLVAQQIARSACTGGILEVNDFSDPARPRIHLVDLATIAPAQDDLVDQTDVETPAADAPGDDAAAGDETPKGGDALTKALAGLLDGVRGRVLLFDRAKNHAALPHRSGRPFDLAAAVEEANRLAVARRSAPDAPPRPPVDVDLVEAEEQTEAAETALRDRHLRPAEHPHAQGLAVLVAELQGRGRPSAPPAPDPVDVPGPDLPPLLPALPLVDAPLANAALVGAPFVSTPLAPFAPLPEGPADGASPPFGVVRTPATAPSGDAATTRARHVLQTELDVLRADVYALVEDAVGRDRAVPHEAHVLDITGIPTPVPAERTVDYLRALLCEDPPKRWHFFKRARAKTFEVVCGKLLAFHAANGHVDSPVVHEVNKLWARLCS